MGVDIHSEVVGDTTVLRVRGDVDLATVDRLDAAIDGILDDEPAALVVDLEGVDHLASVGLSSLLRARSLVDVVVISGCSARSRRTFEAAGLDRFFDFEDTDAPISR
jgi:anti-sigma B factor antagonist